MELVYPKREKPFAIKAIRLVIRDGVAAKYGCDVANLLTIIAITEEDDGGTRPVEFWDVDLSLAINASSPARFRATIDRAIASGWLNVAPADDLNTSKYWLNIPSFEGIDWEETIDSVEIPRRARKCPPFWAKIRLRILERDDRTCGYCGAPANTVDHILPRTMGGDEADDNLVAACHPCNTRKNARTPEEAGMVLLVW